MNRLMVLAVIAGTCTVLELSVRPGAAEPVTAVDRQDTEKLGALKAERRDILRKAIKTALRSLHDGTTDYASVSRVSAAWLSAELDLAAVRNARIAVREEMLKHCRKIEEEILEQVPNRIADDVDLLEAKAERLQAEIDLLRETTD